MSETIEKELSAAEAGAAAAKTLGKRERTKASNKEAILDAAREVFAEVGYGAASVRGIIRRTGLASGTFYNYFKSKEEVFEALMDDGALRIRPVIRAARIASRTFEEFIRNAYKAYFNYVLTDEAQFRLMRRNTGALRVRMVTPEVLAGFDEIQSFVEEDVKSGKVPPMDAELFAAAAVGLAQEMSERMMMRDNPDADEAAEFAANFLLAGLKGVIDRGNAQNNA
jgi:AcrR family transcriptional regulator